MLVLLVELWHAQKKTIVDKKKNFFIDIFLIEDANARPFAAKSPNNLFKQAELAFERRIF